MSDQGLMARKTVEDIIASSNAPDHKLAKTLGPFSITAMGIGAIIGAGIFVLTGTAAAKYAGPSIVLSFVLGGIVCGFVGLCYAELAAMLPVSGSTYTYTYATLGEIFAWMIGWDLILEYAMGAATVAVGWSGYATSLLGAIGVHIPPTLAAAPGTPVKLSDGSEAAALLNLPAALIIVALTAMLILGTRELGPAQQRDGGDQAARGGRLHRGRSLRHRQRALAPVHPATMPANSAISVGAACCAGPAWCSSPFSASTRSRRQLRKPSGRRPTCRSAFSARWRCAPCFMCWWPVC